MANIFKKDNTGQFSRQIPFYPTPTGQPIPVVNAQSNFTNNFGRTLPPTPPVATTPIRTLNTPPTPTPSPYTPPVAQNAPTQQQTSTTDPYTAYTMLLMKQLKEAQSSTDNTDLLKEQRDLSRESNPFSDEAFQL